MSEILREPAEAGGESDVDRRRRAPEREVILAVAAELFERLGYRAVSMQRLAEELKISKPTLYVHVSSKADIVRGIVDDWIACSEKAMMLALSEETAAAQVRTLLATWTTLAVEKASSARFFEQARREVPGEASRYDEWAASAFRRVRSMIETGQKDGEFRRGLDPTVVAFAVLGTINWTARWFDPSGRLTPAEVADQYWNLHGHGLL